jgi:hypothetical protein
LRCHGGHDARVVRTHGSSASSDGTQPGDPAKAAAAILAALSAEHPPLRLALGDDAVDAIRDTLTRRQAVLTAWEPTSRATAFAATARA